MSCCVTGPHSVRLIMADLSLDEIIATRKRGLNFKVQFSYVYCGYILQMMATLVL